MPRTIHNLLTDWGESERTSPARSQALKTEVFAKLPVGTLQVEKPPRRIPWLSLGFAALGLVVFAFNSIETKDHYLSAPHATISESSGSLARETSKIAPDYYFYPPTSPITDHREFLKTGYSAQIRTRAVEQLASRIETIVRGFNGRIDASSSSKRSGYISFAIPADRFYPFKTEIKSLVRERFITESVSSQNLLPQKQSIEEQQAQVEKVLSDLHAQRDALIKERNRVVSSFQGQLGKIAKELAALRAEVTDDPNRKAQIAAREQYLVNQDRAVRNQLANENSNYSAKLASVDANITSTTASLEQIKKQDQVLLDNVATINGTISLDWISVWGMISLYLPEHWLPLLLLALAVVWYVRHRRKMYLPEF